MLDLVNEAVQGGSSQARACKQLGVPPLTLQRWRALGVGADQRSGPKSRPADKLMEAEEQRLLETVNSPLFRDLSPKQILPLLADEGTYIASESTSYRLLRRRDQKAHRGRARPATHRRPEEVIASQPNQVWCWVIT
jgi:putative transposase